MTQKNGTTWKLVTCLLTLFVLSTGAMWAMVSVHAENPHKEAVPRSEFDFFHHAVDARLDRIEAKIDELLVR